MSRGGSQSRTEVHVKCTYLIEMLQYGLKLALADVAKTGRMERVQTLDRCSTGAELKIGNGSEDREALLDPLAYSQEDPTALYNCPRTYVIPSK